MIIRQLKQEKYESITKQLIERAQQETLDASFRIPVAVNGTEYLLKVQPDARHSIVALQAQKISRDEYGQHFELITNNLILSALLELLIVQGLR